MTGAKTKGWTHAICGDCWKAREPERTPVRLKDAPEEWCCFCGAPTMDGIVVRESPAKAAMCQGHEE